MTEAGSPDLSAAFGEKQPGKMHNLHKNP